MSFLGVGCGSQWVEKNRPLYGLLWAFFRWRFQRENILGEKLFWKDTIKQRETLVFFKEFLKDYASSTMHFCHPQSLGDFSIKHKPSDFLQRLTVSLQNFSLSLSGFLRFYSLLSLATKRSCFATYKRALRKFRRERSIYFFWIPSHVPSKFWEGNGFRGNQIPIADTRQSKIKKLLSRRPDRQSAKARKCVLLPSSDFEWWLRNRHLPTNGDFRNGDWMGK